MSVETRSEELDASKSVAGAAPAVPAQCTKAQGTSRTTASLPDSGEVSPSLYPLIQESVQKLQQFLKENPDVAQFIPVLPVGVPVPVCET